MVSHFFRAIYTNTYTTNPKLPSIGVTVGVIGFLASMGFIAGEYLFEQMSSVKTRKHYVLADLGFSGECVLASILYVCFRIDASRFSVRRFLKYVHNYSIIFTTN